MRLRRLRRLGVPAPAAPAATDPTSPQTEEPTQTGSQDDGKTESPDANIPSKFSPSVFVEFLPTHCTPTYFNWLIVQLGIESTIKIVDKTENNMNECNKKIEIKVQSDLIIDCKMETDDWELSKKGSGMFSCCLFGFV